MSGLSPVIKTQEHKTYATFTPCVGIRHSALCLSQPWPWGWHPPVSHRQTCFHSLGLETSHRQRLHDVTMSQCLPGSEWVSECVEVNVPLDTVDDAGHYCYCCCYCCLDHHIITAHINSVACPHRTGTQTHQTQSEDDAYTSTWAVADLGGGMPPPPLGPLPLSSELDSLLCDGDISRDTYSVWEKHRVISDLCVTARNVDLAVLLIWPIVGNCELTVDSFSTVFENVGFVKFS